MSLLDLWEQGTKEEYEFIKNYFQNKTGKFLEIGASNGMDHLYELLELGWTGVYCEPDPITCAQLIANTERYQDQVSIVNGAIVPVGSLQTFYIHTNAIGTSSLKDYWTEENKAQNPNPVVRKILTNTIGVDNLLNAIGVDFDLVSIDAEGSDAEIIKAIPWEKLTNCKMVIVESGYNEELLKFGYQFSHLTTLQNSIYVRN